MEEDRQNKLTTRIHLPPLEREVKIPDWGQNANSEDSDCTVVV